MAKEILVLDTPGCASCKKAEGILKEMKVKYKVIDITKKPEVLKKYQVMSAPGIVIDGKLEFTRVPSKKALAEKLEDK